MPELVGAVPARLQAVRLLGDPSATTKLAGPGEQGRHERPGPAVPRAERGVPADRPTDDLAGRRDHRVAPAGRGDGGQRAPAWVAD